MILFVPTCMSIVCLFPALPVAQTERGRNMESDPKLPSHVSGAIQETISQVMEVARNARFQVTDAMDSLQETQTDSKESSLLASARKLRLQSRYTEAAKIYEYFLTNYSNSSRVFEARFWFAKSLFAAQKWDEAANAFTEFLRYHPDQRMYSQNAKEDRIYCWKVRQKQSPKAVLNLKTALKDPDEIIRIQAALALAENKDATGRKELELGLNNDRLREQCALALWKLGLREHYMKSVENLAFWMRLLVVKVKTDEPSNSFEIKIPLNFFKNIEKMLPPEVKEDMARKGLSDLTKMAATAPKGQVLFQFRDEKTRVTISVDE